MKPLFIVFQACSCYNFFMEEQLAQIEKNALDAINHAGNLDDTEKIRIEYLGRKGALTAILRSLKDLSDEERRRTGAGANALREKIEKALGERIQMIEKTEIDSVLKKEWLDVTRSGIKKERGHTHPLSQLLFEIRSIFGAMGFATVEGPEVETEYYNFDALNIPADHPARDMWDTFWLRQNISRSQQPAASKKRGIKEGELNQSNRLLLRTHTSPVQIRYMEQHNPPIRIIVPGRVYRYEATDASHDTQFYQLEGLMVDKNISIANFKAIIQEFFSQLFTTKVTIRLRPSYFPFTEPSFEVDISCITCDSRGCSVCKKSGWLELAGAGMVHPNVFAAVGYNPKMVQGFAFGMGVDRIAMMKYKISDIRLFRSGDVRFLRQF